MPEEKEPSPILSDRQPLYSWCGLLSAVNYPGWLGALRHWGAGQGERRTGRSRLREPGGCQQSWLGLRWRTPAGFSSPSLHLSFLWWQRWGLLIEDWAKDWPRGFTTPILQMKKLRSKCWSNWTRVTFVIRGRDRIWTLYCLTPKPVCAFSYKAILLHSSMAFLCKVSHIYIIYMFEYVYIIDTSYI